MTSTLDDQWRQQLSDQLRDGRLDARLSARRHHGSLPLSSTIEKYIGSLMLSAALDGSTLGAMLNGLGGSTLDASLISALSGLIGGSTFDSSMLNLALDGLDCVIVDDNIYVLRIQRT